MKPNEIEAWGLMPPRGHWRSMGWRWADWTGGNAMWRHPSGLLAGLSASTERDGNRWLHLSVSHAERLPSYDELAEARRAFIGGRLAYQIFAPESEHVNIHPNCLHMWAPVDHRPLPDFRNSMGDLWGV